MTQPRQTPSARRDELLELAYAFVKENGLADMSLRPLASAIGSSPRVLLFLFGSKDELIRAILRRARREETEFIARNRADGAASLADVVRRTWQWLSKPDHRQVLILWTEAYSRSLTSPAGPWAGFAADTVNDWSALLASAQPAGRRNSRAGVSERSFALAALRGCLLDLLATGDRERTTAAMEVVISALAGP